MIEKINDFYIKFYNQEGVKAIECWESDAKQLDDWIQAYEVEEACKRLNNDRASGKDEIVGELFRYGNQIL